MLNLASLDRIHVLLDHLSASSDHVPESPQQVPTSLDPVPASSDNASTSDYEEEKEDSEMDIEKEDPRWISIRRIPKRIRRRTALTRERVMPPRKRFYFLYASPASVFESDISSEDTTYTATTTIAATTTIVAIEIEEMHVRLHIVESTQTKARGLELKIKRDVRFLLCCTLCDVDRIMLPRKMIQVAIEQLIAKCVAATLAEHKVNRANKTKGPEAIGPVGGVVGRNTTPEVRSCTYKNFMNCNSYTFSGTEGVVGMCRWFEKLESFFWISNCSEENKVKFATCTLQGRALTWWNAYVQSMGINVSYLNPWAELKKMMTVEYCPRNKFQKMEAKL
nr:hypothetical protein [Tanacetum cinerariifolium]